MSDAPVTPTSAFRTPGTIALQARIGEAIAAVGMLTPGLQAVLRVRLYDLLSHHRLSVMKHQVFPANRNAQKTIASRTFRYTKQGGGPERPLDVIAESFAAARAGLAFGEDFFDQVEDGASISAKAPFVVPAGEGARRVAHGIVPTEKFKELLKARAFYISKGGLLFLKEIGVGKKKKPRLFGVLRRGRTQRPILKWFEQFDAVAVRHAAEFESDFETVMKVIDVESAAEGRLESRIVSDASKRAYDRTLARWAAANPGAKPSAARRVARNAARLVRLLAGDGKYGSKPAVDGASKGGA